VAALHGTGEAIVRELLAVHPLAARNAKRRDRERVEARCQKANCAVVSEVFVHEGCLGSGGS